MTNEELADLINARSNNLRDHFDAKLTAVQAHVYGKLLAIESDMLDLRGDIARLREHVATEASKHQ